MLLEAPLDLLPQRSMTGHQLVVPICPPITSCSEHESQPSRHFIRGMDLTACRDRSHAIVAQPV
jgi:hypothetical protein